MSSSSKKKEEVGKPATAKIWISPRSTVTSRGRIFQHTNKGNVSNPPSSISGAYSYEQRVSTGDKKNALDKHQIYLHSLSVASAESSSINTGCGTDEVSYFNIKAEFKSQKIDLEKKQKKIVETFTCLKELHNKFKSSGSGKEINSDELSLKILDVSEWSNNELKKLCEYPQVHPRELQMAGDLPKKILEVAQPPIGLCTELLEKHNCIIEWLEGKGDSAPVESWEALGLGDKITEWKSENTLFLERVELVAQETTKIAQEVTSLIQQNIQLKNNELSSMKNESQKLVLKNGLLSRRQQSSRLKLQSQPDIQFDNKTITKELEDEKVKSVSLKEHISCVDKQLRALRSKTRDLENQLNEKNNTCVQTLTSLNAIENQMKVKDSQYEQRIKHLKDSLRSSENSVAELSKYKIVLETRIQELSSSLEPAKNDGPSDLNAELKALQVEHQLLRNQCEEAEERVTVLQNNNKKLLGIAGNTYTVNHQKGDSSISKELSVTKDMLQATLEELNLLKQDKVTILSEMNKISEAREMLSKDLAAKEKNVLKTVKELKAEVASRDEKIQFYEKKLKNLTQGDKSRDTNIENYHEEIDKLRSSLVEIGEHNEQLLIELTQKKNFIEHKEKAFNEQCRTLKVRDEYIKELKTKDADQLEQIKNLKMTTATQKKQLDEANKNIASNVDEMRQFLSTLTQKQQQIQSLLKMVQSMELQHERCQRRRIQHEKKVYMLEQELNTLKTAQKRRFGFF